MDETAFIQQLASESKKRLRRFPDKQRAHLFVETLFQFLFFRSSDSDRAEQKMLQDYEVLKIDLLVLVEDTGEDPVKSKEQAHRFFSAIPSVHHALMEDAAAILAFDPAAHGLDEVIVSYPGFFATAVYRLSHQLWLQKVALLPRLFAEYAHSKTGIDIHPAARIGPLFSIDHGTGIVIGETAEIGRGVKIYQGVTLGALIVAKEHAQIKRHPTIEDDVVIYAGATILGGETTIGKGSIIGGNVWLTSSIPPGSVVYHKSDIKIRDKEPFPEPLNFFI
jgi:serine O-acetyltransferase